MANIKILVVEDEEIVAVDIASRLIQLGYGVIDTVATGEKAIAIATTEQPDLVLMDIMLRGELDGIEAAHHIRSILKIPVVYLTANTDITTLQRVKLTDPFGYILKPFKTQELQITIEIALSRHQAETEVQNALHQAETKRQVAETNNDLKTQYLSMASHEFRTPLSTIKLSADLLQYYDDRLSDQKRQQYFERIRAATESMNQLLEDVLMWGRVEYGKLEITPTWIDVVSFCQESLEVFQVSVGKEYIFNFTSSSPILEVLLDEKLLWHLLNNLLSNAIKYSPNGGIISLVLDGQEETISLQVQDQGIGMPRDYLNRIFEPFQRADNVGTIPGTGLGLAITKRSADLMGGQIRVSSELGAGTLFTVILPTEAQPTEYQ